MTLPPYLLDLPAEEAARLIALALLDSTADAAQRLVDPTDPTALHDFRVATRRLRSCLQAYRPEIDGSVSPRLRRRLARLARVTGRSRDLEVHLAWEREQETALTGRQLAGLRWHMRRLEARRRRADRKLRHLVDRRFARLERRFRRRLETYRLRIESDPSRLPEAAAVLGGRIRKFGGDLECRLAAIRSLTDDSAYRARVAAKRLRYLLEPIRSEVDGVEPLLAALESLQAALGELYDSQTLRAELPGELAAARREHTHRLETAVNAGTTADLDAPDAGDDPRPGLLALGERLEERAAEAFSRLRSEWLSGAAEGFFEAVTMVGKRIANRPACVAEIERRFLLRDVPATARPFAVQEIEQGWLPGTRIVERIRPLRQGEQRVSFWTARPATEGPPTAPQGEVTQTLFDEIWPFTAGRRVRKRRHVVRDYDLDWEIDQFLDRDLVMAEVAVSEAGPIALPEWLESYVVREVTGERQFTNRALAR